MLRSRHFLGGSGSRRSRSRLRLWRNWFGSGSSQKRRLRRHKRTFFILSSLKVNEQCKSYDHKVLRSCFVTIRLSFSVCQKDAAGAGATLNKAAPALGFGQQKYRFRLHPISGGSRRLRLRNTAFMPSWNGCWAVVFKFLFMFTALRNLCGRCGLLQGLCRGFRPHHPGLYDHIHTVGILAGSILYIYIETNIILESKYTGIYFKRRENGETRVNPDWRPDIFKILEKPVMRNRIKTIRMRIPNFFED